jgi:hypothetical protein
MMHHQERGMAVGQQLAFSTLTSHRLHPAARCCHSSSASDAAAGLARGDLSEPRWTQQHATLHLSVTADCECLRLEFIFNPLPLKVVRLPALMRASVLAEGRPSTKWQARMLTSSTLAGRSAAVTFSAVRVLLNACGQREGRTGWQVCQTRRSTLSNGCMRYQASSTR